MKLYHGVYSLSVGREEEKKKKQGLVNKLYQFVHMVDTLFVAFCSVSAQ